MVDEKTASVCGSFLVIKWLEKISIPFGVFSLCVATIIGEIINTLIVFPIGFHGEYTFHHVLTSIILDVMLFKIIAGVVLAFFTMFVIQILLTKKAT